MFARSCGLNGNGNYKDIGLFGGVKRQTLNKSVKAIF